MPQIREELTLVDNFSSTFNQFNTAADAAIYSAVAFKQSLDRFSEGFLDGFISSLEQAGSEIDEAANSTDEAARAARRAADEQRAVTSETERSAHAATDWVSKIKGAVAALGAAKAVKAFVETSDELSTIKAKIDLMNDGAQETEDLIRMIYISAQDARGSFSDMADMVAKFGNNAKGAFSSSAEVIAFANAVQKAMILNGADGSTAAGAMFQLTQAMGTGVLRGEELNSVFSASPRIIQEIAEEMGVSETQIKQLASEGLITAEIVKNAMLDSARDIDKDFKLMPMTWEQIWQKFQNSALMAFTPVLQRFNELLNSQRFQTFFNSVCEWLYVLADVTMQVFDFMVGCGQAVIDNWSWIAPIIEGVLVALVAYGTYLTILKGIELASAAATGIMTAGKSLLAVAMSVATGATIAETTAQVGLNTAMYACPIVWIIALIGGLIAALILLCNWIAETTGVAQSGIGVITGALAVALAYIGNEMILVTNMAIDMVAIVWNTTAAFANFFGNVFDDPINTVAREFFDLADIVISILQSMASAIDTLFGSNLASAVQGWRNDLGEWTDMKFGHGKEIMEVVNGQDYHIERLDYRKAWDEGVKFGDEIAARINNMFNPTQQRQLSNGAKIDPVKFDPIDPIQAPIDDIAKNTGNIADSMDVLMADEDLKMYRDIAEQRYMNNIELQTLAPNIHVEIPNGSNLSPSDVADAIKAMLIEQQASHTATAHA